MPNNDKTDACRRGVLDTTKEAPYYIPAIDAPARPRRNLKRGDMFAIFDSHGDIGASAGGEDGLFYCDTRLLSHLELLISGSRPLLLASAVDDENIKYHVDLTNPDIFADGNLALSKDTLHLSRTSYLYCNSLRQRIGLANHGSNPIDFTLTLSFASDFADLFEVRGVKRTRRGQLQRPVLSQGSVRLSYRGLDSNLRHAALHFDPVPNHLHQSIATYSISLLPHQKLALFVTVSSENDSPAAATTFVHGLVHLNRIHKSRMRTVAWVETENATHNEILHRSMADLHMLMATSEDGPYPHAGIPWYSTVFGRDGLITAFETLWLDASIAAGVLKQLARLQADMFDRKTDAAPGKILHEMRSGEMAVLGEIPFRQYYGTIDATPLFVMLAGAYGERTGDWNLVRQIWPNIERALAWIDGPADADGDGFVEYARGAESGLANQGWKDSHDSVFHADGQLAEGPIALAEVQGYCYAARIAAAKCAAMLGMPNKSDKLLAEAQRLRQLFEERFWCDDISFYAMALDRRKSPCRVLSSNPGHALWSGITDPEHGKVIASRFLSSEFFSGWGVRTIAQGEARYNPMSYHNGSIWPHDNAILAAGLARVGLKSGVVAIFEGVMRAASYLDHRRIPELFCGFRRRTGQSPTLYPAACSPQAWAAASPFYLIAIMLGLEFRPEDKEIRLNNPVVPPSAGAVTLRNVALGAARADFTVRRSEGGVAFDVLRKQGELRISLIVDQ